MRRRRGMYSESELAALRLLEGVCKIGEEDVVDWEKVIEEAKGMLGDSVVSVRAAVLEARRSGRPLIEVVHERFPEPMSEEEVREWWERGL